MTKLELMATLSQGRIESVIDELNNIKNEHNIKEVILISQRFSELENRRSAGVIKNEDYTVERNKIAGTLYEIINRIDFKSNQSIGNWKLNWISNKYPDSLIKEDNQLPILREFVKSKLDFRVILPEKFDMKDKLPYSGEVGINFMNFDDDDKINMSIDLGINLILLGDMKKFILGVIVPPVKENLLNERCAEVKYLISEAYNYEIIGSKIEIEMIKTNDKNGSQQSAKRS